MAAFARPYGPQERAHNAVRKAIASGALPQPGNCEACDAPQGRYPSRRGAVGLRRVEYHHDDYAKPLAVRALCRPCHQRAHSAAKGA